MFQSRGCGRGGRGDGGASQREIRVAKGGAEEAPAADCAARHGLGVRRAAIARCVTRAPQRKEGGGSGGPFPCAVDAGRHGPQGGPGASA